MTVVIGGGAAGLMSAYTSASMGEKTVIIEKNRFCGKKLNITGKGRCNVTNNCDVDTFLQNVPVNPKFLYKALNAFPPSAMMDFLEANSVKLVTERGRRVFPASNKASDITAALESAARNAGASVIFGNVTDIIYENGAVSAVEYTAKTKCRIIADKVIVATGGLSYPATGSTGDGYEFARKAGHTIIAPRPSLVPLNASGNVCKRCMGLSLKNVRATFKTKSGKELYTDMGEMLFAHFGVTGPIILSASAHIGNLHEHVILYIDLKPALDTQTLDKRLLKDFAEYINKDFINALGMLLPQKIIEPVVELSGIDPHEKVNIITKTQRRDLIKAIKEFPVEIIGFRPIDEAIITSGGVSTKEINPSTMESKLVKGLYFAGEVIDIDCYTGGYNLQAAFSTASLAGRK